MIMIDTSLNVATVLLIGLVVLWAAVWCFAKRRDRRLLCSVSSLGRGTKAERKLIVRLRKEGVHPAAIFHDLYVRKGNGEYSQIDIVVACPQGLIVIEVKDYSGWLFGRENQVYWTQVLNYGKEKYRFYNPLMQNAGHIKALRKQSAQFSRLPIFNVVLFAGTCVLKNIRYDGSEAFVGYVSDIKYVLRFVASLPYAEYSDKKEIAHILHVAVRNGNDERIVADHIDSVREKSRNRPSPIIKRSWHLFSLRKWIRF